ncbi:MAG: hypothetical protein ACRBN8_31215 [Nannocystales bacterium]
MLAWALMLSLMGGELRWQAPVDQCPSAKMVRAQIDAAGGLGELQVDAVVTAEPSGQWMLVLTTVLDDVSDARTFRDANCAALAEAAVLLVATRLDLERAESSSPGRTPPLVEPPPSGSPQSAPTRAGDPGEPPVAPEQRRVQPSLETREPAFTLPAGWTFAVAAGLSQGTVPTPGVPSELAMGHAWPMVRLSLRGRVHVGALDGLGETGSIRIVLGTVGPGVCARATWRRLEFPLCAELGVGGSRAVTRGSARDRGGLWVEAGLGGGLAWFVDPRWSLTAHFAGTTPLVGSGYALGDAELWNPGPIAGRVMLGVEFLVPIQIGSRPEKSQ